MAAVSFITKRSKMSQASTGNRTLLTDSGLELLRITLKKETDRQERMEKLLETYISINTQ